MSSAVIGALRVVFGADTAAFEQGVTKAERKAASFEKRMTQLGGKISGIGKTLSIGLTAPLAAFGVSAFKAASDAAELQSAFDQTFGSMSKSMNVWAEQTGNAMGRSTQEMQRAASTFGIFFNQAAPTAQAAADMSKQFSVLAQDLASFYNVDVETAIGKLRSGLAGESEPLRDFGVFLTEAAVKAKAMEMGLAGVGDEISEQEKIQARYALILEQTANAQGDVARTSDGTANQMRAAKAAFEELQVVVGTKLLPALTPLIEKIGAAIQWFTSLPEPVQDTALVVAALAAALGPVLAAIGSIITIAPAVATAFGVIKVAALGLMANPVILAFAAVIAGIYLAWKNWDKIEAIVRNLYSGVKKWLQDKLGPIFNWVRDKVAAVTGFFKDMYVAVVGNSWVPDMVEGIAAEMSRLESVMVAPARAATSAVSESMRQMADETRSLLARLFPEVEKLMGYREDLAKIDRSSLSDDQKAEARRRARQLFQGETPGGRIIGAITANDNPIIPPEVLRQQGEKVNAELDKFGRKAQVQTVRIEKSFKDMADGILGSLQGLVNGIKGGGFLDILGGVIDLLLQLGSAGVFGKSIQTNINKPIDGARANGGPVMGGKTYLVGERGPELFTAPGMGKIVSNDNLKGMGGGMQVQVVPSPYFDVVVDGRIVQSAPAVANAGAQLAAANASRMQRRTVRR